MFTLGKSKNKTINKEYLQKNFWGLRLGIILLYGGPVNQIGGALGRLGGATKELPANLDTQTDTQKPRILFEILVFLGGVFGMEMS